MCYHLKIRCGGRGVGGAVMGSSVSAEMTAAGEHHCDSLWGENVMNVYQSQSGGGNSFALK